MEQLTRDLILPPPPCTQPAKELTRDSILPPRPYIQLVNELTRDETLPDRLGPPDPPSPPDPPRPPAMSEDDKRPGTSDELQKFVSRQDTPYSVEATIEITPWSTSLRVEAGGVHWQGYVAIGKV